MLFDIMNEESKDKGQGQDVADSPALLEPKVNTDLAKHDVHESNFGLTAINLFDAKQLAAAENFLNKIIRSEKGGIKSVNDGLAVLMRAQDLQIPFSTSIEHIHVINGKTGIDIHIIKALLLKAGVVWRNTKDYTPLYEYTDGINAYVEDKLPADAIKCKSSKEANAKAEEDNKNGIDNIYVYPVKFYQGYDGNIYKDYQLNSNFAVALNKQHAQQLIGNKKIPIFRIPAVPCDYRTSYWFKRYFNVNGKLELVEAIGHYSYSEAVTADAFSKDTYKKYARIMIGHRAFVYGAREIASDLLMGCMEITELKQINNIDITDADVIEIS